LTEYRNGVDSTVEVRRWAASTADGVIRRSPNWRNSLVAVTDMSPVAGEVVLI
jgi:hypothetical protein